jgi:hypothetical protein
MSTKTDLRQTKFVGPISQLSTTQVTEGDNIVQSINDELTPLLRLSASTPPSLVLNVGGSDLLNAESNRRRAISHIGKTYVTFTSGTITFPAASGGNIVCSPGTSTVLTCPSGQFAAVLVYLNATGNLSTLVGTPGATPSLAISALPPAPNNTLAIGFVVVENVGGTIQNISNSAIRQFSSGSGSSSSGSGTGIGSDLNNLTYKAEFSDTFNDLPSDTASAVDYTAGRTDPATYDIVNGYHRLAFDATRTVTGTGVAMTLNGAPSFTIKTGDILVVGAEARRITSLTSQTVFNVEAAFSVDPSAAACNVSQAVYTKDLNNFAADGLAISATLTSDINEVLVIYEDTQTANDIILDNGVAPHVAFVASSDGVEFSNVSLRPQQASDEASSVNLPTSSNNLFLRFFANKSSGSGFVNILGYRAFFHKDPVFQDGNLLNQALAFTNGDGTEVNCQPPSVVGGKTRLQLSWTYPVGVNPGTANGSIEVYLNGQKIPRFIDATLTPDASYIELDERTIELDTDYSSFAFSLEVIRRVAVVDQSETNTTALSEIQEAAKLQLQSFVDQSKLLTPTSVTGTPAAGTFYSSVLNRKPIVDLTQDLLPRMAIDRQQAQGIYRITNESGPNGEVVFGLVGDKFDQVRMVGGAWAYIANTDGAFPVTGNTADYVEITFYGTGLNFLTFCSNTNTLDLRASVNGGAEGGNLLPTTTPSTILQQRKYSANHVVNAASGLPLGIHTVRIRRNSGTSNFNFNGFEVLNESANVVVTPGSAFVNLKKTSLNSQQVLPFDSGFESGTLGTRGGRVLTYLKADGTIGRAVNPTNTTQQNLTAADHTNEEVARVYNFREFGAGRSDDFSTLVNSSSSRAFTLDDGTTTLAGLNQRAASFGGRPEGVYTSNTVGDFISFTFVGTGLDIDNVNTANPDATYTISVDGTNIGTGLTGSALRSGATIKIVSGLPYGTHTVTITQTGVATSSALLISNFTVYQPKTPELPSGAVALGAYNVMANYIPNSTPGLSTIATGVLRKHASREFVYVNGTGGTSNWNTSLNVPVVIGGVELLSDRQNAYFEYTFFGTGAELRFIGFSNRSANISVSLQNLSSGGNLLALTTANFPTLVSSVYGTGITFNAATGILDQLDTTTTVGAGFSFRNLPLGLYKVRFNNNTAGSFLQVETLDIITPIHSYKAIEGRNFQNASLVGSQGIEDLRNTSMIKGLDQSKNVSQAFGVTLNPTTTSSGSPVPLPDMSVVHYSKTGKVKVSGFATVSGGTLGGFLKVYVNGESTPGPISLFASTTQISLPFEEIVDVQPGPNKIDIYWAVVSAGTITANENRRVLTVEDV